MNRDDMHTCHAECQRPICVAVREAIAATQAVAVTQREWQGLTDEEAKEVWKQLNYDLNHGKFAADDTERHVIVEFYRAIEAKLKEKNG